MECREYTRVSHLSNKDEQEGEIGHPKRFAYFSLFLGAGFLWLFALAVYGALESDTNLDWTIWLFIIFILFLGIYLLVEGLLRLRIVRKKACCGRKESPNSNASKFSEEKG